MRLSDFSFDYRWIDSTKDRKGPKLVLILYEEFESYYDIPDSLFVILDFCAENIPELEAALAEAVIQLPIWDRLGKEAT